MGVVDFIKTNKRRMTGFFASALLFPFVVITSFPNGQINASEMSSAEILASSPIEKAYAGAEFVLFMHKDTSISGLGSNVGNVLGMSGGEGKNTGSLVRVSGPTGFEKLKVKQGLAFGFKPIHERDGLYEVYRFDTQLRRIKNGVRDYDHSGRTGYNTNPHDGEGYVTTDGILYQTGSDYSINLGIGRYWVGKAYLNGEHYGVLAPDDSKRETLVTLATTDRSDTQRTYVTQEFTTLGNNDKITIDFSYDKSSGVEIRDTYAKIDLIDSKGNVVFTDSNVYDIHRDVLPDRRELEVKNLIPGEKYRLRITVKNTGFNVSVRDRKYLENVTNLYWSTRGGSYSAGDFVAVVDNKDIYVHRQTWGNVRKLEVPDGIELVPDSIVTGVGPGYFVLDKDSVLYSFRSNNDLKRVEFPKVDGKDFYEVYKIKEAAKGGNFDVVLVEDRKTGETRVYAWGNNKHGQLPIEGLKKGESVSEPTLLTRNGEVITNVQTIAAGMDFLVIVQNTDEGQLVWTSGHNAKGQLGGGINLNISEPKLVPGLRGIKNLIVRNTPEVIAVGQDAIYSFGGTKSYPEITNMSRVNPVLRDELPLKWDQAQLNYWKEDAFTIPTGTTVILTESERKAYAYGYAGYSSTVVMGRNFSEVLSHPDFDGMYGKTSESRDFKNVKDVAAIGFSGAIIDEFGRIWGWGTWGVANQHNISPDPRTGKMRYTNYAHPYKYSNGEVVPAIFEQITGIYNRAFALDKYGKLWHIYDTISPISSRFAINDVKVTKIDSALHYEFTAIDENGEVWYWRETNEPKKIPKSKFDGLKVVDVATSTNHRIFLTEDGHVWGMGNNDNGKLGIGSMEHTTEPKKVFNIEKATKVFAGENVSFAIDEEGRVWAWGYAAYGSLGDNFSLSREKLSTAAGNDLPVLTILNTIENTYLSEKGKRSFTFFGEIAEPEQETTTITIDLLGVEKVYTVNAEDWELDIYDKTIPKRWELTWDISEITDMDSQFLTKVTAEDGRGGIVEQYFSGNIIIDNEIPEIPTWGETCILDKNGNEQSCHSGQYFRHQGGNPVNTPIRLYANVQQKDGINKAPTYVQYQYRKLHPHGYINDWSEWITMTKRNENGFYEDFFEGFLGEHQIRIRAIDAAENVSQIQKETRYTLISNAGAEVEKLTAVPGIKDNKLYNEITIKGMTPDNSKILSYSVKRHKKGEKDAEGNEVWVDLTNGRQIWEANGNEMVFVDEDKNLVGNAEYIYKVDLENSITVGKSKEVSVITEVYEPVNFTRVPTEEGIDVSITQSERNEGEILYRLVLIESRTGLTAQFDYVSNRREEDVIYRVKKSDVKKYELKNNKIDILLVYKGANGNYHTIVYDKEFNLNEKILNDVVPPNVTFDLGVFSRLSENDSKKIELTLFASDDNTAPKDLQVQFSKDGSRWFGYREGGTWHENHWGTYQTVYKNFDVSDLSGRHMIYARVRDEAGNIGYDSQEILIAQNAYRNNEEYAYDANSRDEIIDDDNRIHVNTNNVELRIPRSGDLTEVQYSFDGVQWFDWEPIPSNGIKYIELTQGEGQKAVYTRYRNKHESVTPVKEKDIIRYVLDYSPPSLKFKTGNGTLITKIEGVLLFVTPLDNFSNVMNIELESNNYTMHEFVAGEPQITGPVKLSRETTYPIIIKGLVPGFNEITFKVKDRAGNESKESIRIYRKD